MIFIMEIMYILTFFTFFSPMCQRESVVFGSNFQNWDFDGFTCFQVLWIKKIKYFVVFLCVCVGNRWSFVSCYFMQFLNKLNLKYIKIYIQLNKNIYSIHKNLYSMYRGIQNWSNLLFSTQGFILIFLNILI